MTCGMNGTSINEPAIGVIGGSGLYEIAGFEGISEIRVETPFGDPSDKVVSGRIGGRRVCFLPRHGVGHRLLPHEINHRANIWALRSLGVRWVISVTAVGSLREELAPRDIVVPDQLIDRTGTAAKSPTVTERLSPPGFSRWPMPGLAPIHRSVGGSVSDFFTLSDFATCSTTELVTPTSSRVTGTTTRKSMSPHGTTQRD